MAGDTQEVLQVEALPGYPAEIGRWLRALQGVRREVLKSVQGLSAKELDTMPPGADNTIGALLYHIALVEASWLYQDTLQRDSLPPEIEALFPLDSRDEQRRLSALRGTSLEDYVARLQQVRSALLQEFKGITREDFKRLRHFPGQYDVTPEWVLYHLIQHEAEHGGHIQTLRTLLKSQARG